MSLEIYVDAHSGYRANEQPRQFQLDEDLFEIEAVEDRWYDLHAEYFKVRTVDGRCFLLKYDTTQDKWTLESGFDGDELLVRPSIELISVDAKALRETESQIAGCERCRPEDAEIPFDWILADVLDKRGPFEFI